MKKNAPWFAALWLLLMAAFPAWCESGLEETARKLNDEWAVIFYTQPPNKQAEQFKALLTKIRAFKNQAPDKAEPLILEGITLCTLVAAEWSFSALGNIAHARELLIKSIDINPKAMEASAYIALGNLYFRLPGWPISFGDNRHARQYLEAAAKLYPDAIDANYFLGEFLLSEEKYALALPYLEKAAKAPIRPEHLLSDRHTLGEARQALEAARNHKSGRNNFFSQIVPSFFKQ